MKRIIAAVTLAIIAAFTFASCNTAEEAVSGASDVMRGAGEDISDVASGAGDMLDGDNNSNNRNDDNNSNNRNGDNNNKNRNGNNSMTNDGDVSDGNGIIGDEGNTSAANRQ